MRKHMSLILGMCTIITACIAYFFVPVEWINGYFVGSGSSILGASLIMYWEDKE